MQNDPIDQTSKLAGNPVEHMANERTFLAWIRTSIGIMAFGFVVERFALFLKQIAYFLIQPPVTGQPSAISLSKNSGTSSIFGALIVFLGVLISIFAFVSFKRTEKQLKMNTYKPSALLDVLLMVAVVLIGFYLVSYLVNSI